MLAASWLDLRNAEGYRTFSYRYAIGDINHFPGL